MNAITFVLFRILLLGWMTLHRDEVSLLFFTIGSTGLATIVGMNIILFYRIITSDHLKNNKDPAFKTDEKINENGDTNSECVN